jgi:hypothetical protein
MLLVLMPYGIFESSVSEKLPCKPVKDSISSNCVGERVGKSPVAKLLEDVIGAHALRHLRKLRLRKFPCKLVKDSISKIVLSNSKICKN